MYMSPKNGVWFSSRKEYRGKAEKEESCVVRGEEQRL